MGKYIVFINNSKVHEFKKYAIVDAENQKDAKEIFGRDIIIKDENFLENFVYDRAVNTALPNLFFRDEKGHFLDGFGQYRKGLKGEYIQKTFEKNMKEFFKDNDEYFYIYFNYYFKNKEYMNKFPEKMLLYIFNNSDYYDIIVRNIENIQILC